jgi:hemophore-related protein
MIDISTTKVAIAIGGLAFALTAGAGIASASPDVGPMVNTTCSYDQVISALNAQDSAAGAQFGASPMTQSALRQFLAASPGDRQQMAEMMASSPANQPYVGLMQAVFNTCNTF